MKPELRTAYKDWFNQEDSSWAFTGTAKQVLESPHHNQSRRWITVNDLEKNVAFFMERMSRDLLGRKAVRQGNRLGYCGVIEGGELPAKYGGKRYHVHLGLSLIHI